MGGGTPVGALGFTSRTEREWPNALVKRLQLVAQIFANALARKRADQQLRERNQYIETVFEQAPIGFAVHGIDDGAGRFVSARHEEIYGVRRGTIDSHYTFFETVWPNHPDLREQIRRRVVADMASGDGNRMHWENVPVPLPSGETRYITAVNIPVPSPELLT